MSFPVVCEDSDTGEVLIWPSELENKSFGRRKPDGSWIFGTDAVATPDELNDKFAPVMDDKRAATLLHEAKAAFASSPVRFRQALKGELNEEVSQETNDELALENLEPGSAGPSSVDMDAEVFFSPETGATVAWFSNGDAVRRLKDGSWVFGNAAVPTPFELKEYFEKVKDPRRAATFLQMARAAFSERPSVAGGETPVINGVDTGAGSEEGALEKSQGMIIRDYNPRDNRWWGVALDNLEEQWPDRLEKLLRQGKLAEHLDKLVEACDRQAQTLRDGGLGEVEAANEISPLLEPQNPAEDRGS